MPNKYAHIVQDSKGLRAFSSYQKAHKKLLSEGYITTYQDGVIAKFKGNDKSATIITLLIN